MSYNEFVGFLNDSHKRTMRNFIIVNLIYKSQKVLTLISNELQYQEFIDIAYRCGVQLLVYMDHFGTTMHVTKENVNEDNCSVKSNMSIEGGEGIDLTNFISPQQSSMVGVTYEGVIQETGNEDATEGDPKDDEDENVPDVKGKQCLMKTYLGQQLPILGMSKRLLVKCCDGECTFRLWASWMSDEHSFQVKSLINDHNYARNFKLGSIVNYR
uniref:Transposase MuDR plant domain-containing protein n=1 Tax=Lactuca sativa TaxID=4236 RepID=A0A9R1UIM3_LACSA|nr:hypothetical protein LSAT_V11C900458930 [Lactuca sativa]